MPLFRTKRKRIYCLLTISVCLVVLSSLSCLANDIGAKWISIQDFDKKDTGAVVYHKRFKIDFNVTEAYFKYACYTPEDFGGTTFRAYVNNVAGAECTYWRDAQYMSLTKILRNGDNDVCIEVKWNNPGISGPVLAKIVVKGKDTDGKDKSITVYSDDTWDYTVGEFKKIGLLDSNKGSKEVKAANPTDDWKTENNPSVLPKLDTSELSGVTGLNIDSGYLGTTSLFDDIKDLKDKLYIFKLLGVSAIQVRNFGQSTYQQPGSWFWGYDKEVKRNLEMAGLDYSINPWLWIPANWYVQQKTPTMIQCMEDADDGVSISIWNPLLLTLNKDFYSSLKQNMGDSIKSIHPGIYGDYGETCFMAGSNPLLVSEDAHLHQGFWTGDELARADFQKKMMEKYKTLSALNKAWDKDFENEDAITYPTLTGLEARRYVLDFVDWYCNTMKEYTSNVCTAVRDEFPNISISPKMECVDENPMSGQDYSQIPKALAKIGAGVCEANGIGSYYQTRRIANACKFYKVPLEVEISDNVDKNAERDLFTLASNGVIDITAEPLWLLKSSDDLSRYRSNIRGDYSLTQAALFFPTSWHRYNALDDNPPRLVQAAEELRDYMDYDVVDENMVGEGALAGYKVLVMFDGNFMEQATYDCISQWVDNGGTLIITSDQLPMTNVEEDQLSISKYSDQHSPGTSIFSQGNGRIILWNGDWDSRKDYYSMISSEIKGSPDCKADGVWTSVFQNRILYFNSTDSPVHIKESISEDTAKQMGLKYKPELLNYELDVPANGQEVHFIDKPLVNVTVECENMESAAKYPENYSVIGSWGVPAKSLSVPAGGFLKSAIQIPADGTYGIAFIGSPSDNDDASLEIDGKKVINLSGQSGPFKYMYPLAAKIPLKAGKHIITIRTKNCEVTADKVIFTTDVDLAGFTYSFIDPMADQNW